MKRVTLTVRDTLGGPFDIEGYISDADDLFAVHHALEYHEPPIWVISHRKVGFKIPRLTFGKRKAALRAAAEFNRLPGWQTAFFDETTRKTGGVSQTARNRATKLITFLNDMRI